MRQRWFIRPLLVLLALSALGSGSAAQTRAPRLKEVMTAAEFARCGLSKLTATELAALEEWFFARGAVRGSVAGAPSLAATPGQGAIRSEEIVSFNTASAKYHCRTCQWALRCTRNCVNIPLSEASARGVPCRICGGSCR